MCSCSARAVLHRSHASISRGPDNVRSRRLAADVSTTIAGYEDERTYQVSGRSMSSRFGREHARQQASVVSRGRESAYATHRQISMSRRASQQGGTGSGPQAMHVQPVSAQAAAIEPTSQHNAAVQPVTQEAHGAHSHHSSTATLAYAPGQGSISRRKRPFEDSLDDQPDDHRAQASHEDTEGCTTRARTRRAPNPE